MSNGLNFTRTSPRLRRILSLALPALLLGLFGLGAWAQPRGLAETGRGHALAAEERPVFLPFITGGAARSGTSPTPTTPIVATPTTPIVATPTTPIVATPAPTTPTATTSPVPGPAGGSFFLDRARWTVGPSAALDKDGGIHIAYVAYAERPGEAQSAFYAYCPDQAPGQCDSPAGWRVVPIGSRVRYAQLQLTPGGQPRLLLETVPPPNGNFERPAQLIYASCEQGCLEPGAWRLLPLVLFEDPNTVTFSSVQRGFALDSQGRPRVALAVAGNPIQYLFCDESCATIANWRNGALPSIQTFFSEQAHGLALKIGPDGDAHLLAEIRGSTNAQGVHYFRCAAQCDSPQSWQSYQLTRDPKQLDAEPPSAAPITARPLEFDLELDAAGRPRLLFLGVLENGNARLFYASCDAECTQASGWSHADIGSAGGNISLVLDRQGRPHGTIMGSDARSQEPIVAYIRCESGCATSPQGWQIDIVDRAAAFEREVPMAGKTPDRCLDTPNMGSWQPNSSAALLLSRSGKPRILGDIQYAVRCTWAIPTPVPIGPPRNEYAPLGMYHGVRWIAFDPVP